MAMRVRTSQSRGDPYHHPWINPAAPGHMTSMRLAASWGVEIHRLQRPSIRAGSHARHLILSASVDASRKAQRRRPHLNRSTRHWHTGSLRQLVMSVCPGHRVYESRVE